MTNREAISHAIDRARRAQLAAQGGYRKIEDDAQGHDRWLRNRAGISPPIMAAERPDRRKLSEAQLAQARAMRAAGVTFKAIGMQFGVHPRTISYWLDPAYHEKQAMRKRGAA